jgi:peptide/nickel transport system substrate-binding protein
VTRWEPASFIEGEAFDGHVLGRPKIDRLVLRIFNDENTVLANVLAGGQVHFTNNFTLRFEHVPTLRQQWESAGRGIVAPSQSSAQTLNVQARPEFVGDPALLDVRVRRAIAHTLDREAVNVGAFDGIGYPTETFVPEDEPIHADLERVRMKYPFDGRRAEQLMAEVGFTRDAAGLFADASGRRFRLDFVVSDGPENERVQAILADSWRRAGFDVYAAQLSQADARIFRNRHVFPGLAQRGGAPDESHFIASEIGSDANRWAGDNRGGWSSPEYERLFQAFSSSLDTRERRQLSVQMLALWSESVFAYPLYFRTNVRTWVTNLHGPDRNEPAGFGLVTQPATQHWNIHEWEFRDPAR